MISTACRVLVLLMLTLLCGCNPHREELADIVRDYDAQLQALQEVAMTLNDQRKAIDAAEDWLERPEGAPPFIPAFPPLMPFKPRTVPSVSLAEGDESARLRAQLGRQDGKIREILKVISAIAALDSRKDELNEKLRKLEEVRRAAPTPAP